MVRKPIQAANVRCAAPSSSSASRPLPPTGSPRMNPDLPQAVVLHASCLDLDGKGVLIEGRPGAGKSDLSLRLIDQPGRGLTGDALKGARLVADDQVVV